MTTKNKVIISILSCVLALLIIGMSVFLVFTAMTAKSQSSFSITFTSSVPNNFTLEWSVVADGSYDYYVSNDKEYPYFQMNGDDVYHALPGAGTVLGRGKYKYRQGTATSRTITMKSGTILSDSDIWMGFAITPDVLKPVDISIGIDNNSSNHIQNMQIELYERESENLDDSLLSYSSSSYGNCLAVGKYKLNGTLDTSSVFWNTTTHPSLSSIGTEARSFTFNDNSFSYYKAGATTLTIVYIRISAYDISSVADLLGNLVVNVTSA